MTVLVSMLVVMAIAILVALAFARKQLAGMGCILSLAVMSCGFLALLTNLFLAR